MRVCSAFCRLLRLEGIWVRSVVFEDDTVIVGVRLRRRRLVCAHCAFSTRHRENVQDHESVWRHLDLGVWRLEIRATLRRLVCPTHGAHVEGVPFARHGARLTVDFENLVAWLVTKTDKTATCRLTRIDWQTIGRIIERVGDEHLSQDRLSDLFEISIDEVAWRRGHRHGILAARRLRLSNARAEALNNKAKLIVRRAYGFHSARAALALIHLTCGPITLTLPHQQTA